MTLRLTAWNITQTMLTWVMMGKPQSLRKSKFLLWVAVTKQYLYFGAMIFHQVTNRRQFLYLHKLCLSMALANTTLLNMQQA